MDNISVEQISRQNEYQSTTVFESSRKSSTARFQQISALQKNSNRTAVAIGNLLCEKKEPIRMLRSTLHPVLPHRQRLLERDRRIGFAHLGQCKTDFNKPCPMHHFIAVSSSTVTAMTLAKRYSSAEDTSYACGVGRLIGGCFLLSVFESGGKQPKKRKRAFFWGF
jgi:hypothetical protein